MASSIASPATLTAPRQSPNSSRCNFSCAKAQQKQTGIEPGKTENATSPKPMRAISPPSPSQPSQGCRSLILENRVMSDGPVMEVGHVDLYPASIQSHPDGIPWIGLGTRCCGE